MDALCQPHQVSLAEEFGALFTENATVDSAAFGHFEGRAQIQDLFVHADQRRHGYGRALIKMLAEMCVQRGYERFEWVVLDWNEPSIRFYRSIGAVGMDEWKVQRLSGDALTRLALSDQ